MSEPDHGSEVIQVVMLDAFRPRFEAWLRSEGFLLGRIPMSDPDELATYVVGPTDELLAMVDVEARQ